MKRNDGFTLIELLVTISAGALVTFAAVSSSVMAGSNSLSAALHFSSFIPPQNTGLSPVFMRLISIYTYEKLINNHHFLYFHNNWQNHRITFCLLP